MALLFGICLVATPGWVTVAWGAIGLLSTSAVVLGTLRNAPQRRAPWWLMAGGILAMAAGDAVYSMSTHLEHGPPAVIADVCYFAMFPLIMASLAILTRAGMVLGDRSRLLDLLAFTCAAALVAWVLLISPSLTAPYLDATQRSVLAAYILGDLLVLIVSVRLWIAARRSWAVVLLVAGSGGLLAANIADALAQLGDGWRSNDPVALGYLMLYVTWGAAALHPSMAALTAPAAARITRPDDGWRIGWLRVCLAVPAGTLLLEAAAGQVRDGIVIAVASIVMYELVITQLADMVGKHRRVIARERGLREACGELVAAVDPGAVRDAVRTAVGRLVPPGTAHRVLLATDTAPTAPPAAASGGAELVPHPAVRWGTRLLPTRLLPPALHDELQGFGTTLVCPLVLGRPTRRGCAATLFVAAPERALAAMRDAVEVLAAQAALALERMALTDVVNRRDGDRYLRAVVQNTADVVLIIDDDDRIRYASPSLAAVLGVEPAAYSTLHDIVHPDDHGQLARTRASADRFTGPDGARDVWNLRRPDGSRVLVEVSYRDLRGDRLVRGFVITMSDITERRAREQELIRRTLQRSGGWRNRQSSLSRFR